MEKQDFIRTIAQIQNFHSHQDTIQSIINKLTENSPVVVLGDCLVNELIRIINKSLKIIDNDLISWWLYEDVEKVIWVNKGQKDEEQYLVETSEQLYDYITKFYGKGED